MDTTTNPLLDTGDLPAFSAIRPEHVEPAIDTLIASQREGIARIAAPGAERDFEHVMLAQERLDQALSRSWSPVSHLHSVADSEALRKAHGNAEEKLTDLGIEIGQNRDLYAAVQAVADRPEFAAMPAAARAAVEHALRDFRLSGVALEEPARSRFREIGVELSRLTTEFSNAVLDATEAWHKHITDERDLVGIPVSGRAVLREYAREEKLDGYLVTLKQPSVQAVLTYAENRDLREAVYYAYQTRASDQGPDKGKFDNSERIERSWPCAMRRRSCSASATRPRNRWRRRWRGRPIPCWRSCAISLLGPSRSPARNWRSCAGSRRKN